MKRVKIFSFCMILLILVSSCGGGKSPVMSAKNGAYNAKPQQIVDALNASIESKGDSRYLKIPDYVSSGEKIEIDWLGLELTLYENEDGYLTKIEIMWSTFNQTTERVNTCGLIIGNLVGSISPENYDTVYDKLDIDASGSHEYTTTAESDGTTYTYKYILNGMYQYLTIEPTDKG